MPSIELGDDGLRHAPATTWPAETDVTTVLVL